jgi:cellobiose phosphorylase
MARNTQGQSGLFACGISGDYPIVLVKVDDHSGLPLVRQMLLAQQYLRMRNFTLDLVILNQHAATYADPLQNAIQAMIDTSLSHLWVDRPGGVFLRRDYLPPPRQSPLTRRARHLYMTGVTDQLDQRHAIALPQSVPTPVLHT